MAARQSSRVLILCAAVLLLGLALLSVRVERKRGSLLSRASKVSDEKAEKSYTSFWDKVNARDHADEQKIHNLEQERLKDHVGTQYESDKASTYFNGGKARGQPEKAARPVGKASVLSRSGNGGGGLAGGQERAVEDRYFDSIVPHLDDQKRAWERDYDTRETKLGQLRRRADSATFDEKKTIDEYWEKRAALDRKRGELHSVYAMEVKHDALLKAEEAYDSGTNNALAHQQVKHFSHEAKNDVKNEWTSSTTKPLHTLTMTPLNTRPLEPAFPPEGWEPSDEVNRVSSLQHNTGDSEVHLSKASLQQDTAGKIALDGEDAGVRSEVGARAALVKGDAKLDAAAHTSATHAARKVDEKVPAGSSDSRATRAQMMQKASKGLMGEGLGGLLAEMFGGESKAQRHARQASYVSSALGVPHSPVHGVSGATTLVRVSEPAKHVAKKPINGHEAVRDAGKGTMGIQNLFEHLADGSPLKLSRAPTLKEIKQASKRLEDPASEGYVIGGQNSVFQDEKGDPTKSKPMSIIEDLGLKATSQSLAEMGSRHLEPAFPPPGWEPRIVQGAGERLGSQQAREREEAFFDDKAKADAAYDAAAKERERALSVYDVTKKQREARADMSDKDDTARDDAFFDKIAAHDEAKAARGPEVYDEESEAKYVKSHLTARAAHQRTVTTPAQKAAREWGFAEKSVGEHAAPRTPESPVRKAHQSGAAAPGARQHISDVKSGLVSARGSAGASGDAVHTSSHGVVPQRAAIKGTATATGGRAFRGIWARVLDPWHLFS